MEVLKQLVLVLDFEAIVQNVCLVYQLPQALECQIALKLHDLSIVVEDHFDHLHSFFLVRILPEVEGLQIGGGDPQDIGDPNDVFCSQSLAQLSFDVNEEVVRHLLNAFWIGLGLIGLIEVKNAVVELEQNFLLLDF